MFVEAVRRYVETLPADRKGWLAGLRDPVVERALAALRAEAREPATVARLAASSGYRDPCSPSGSPRWSAEPPMQYLALWRMRLASRLLVDGGQVAAVANPVGSESGAAFSRTFKKLVGQSPAAWRKEGGLAAR